MQSLRNAVHVYLKVVNLQSLIILYKQVLFDLVSCNTILINNSGEADNT